MTQRPAASNKTTSARAIKNLRRMVAHLNTELQPKPPLPDTITTLDGRAADLLRHFQRQQGLLVSGRLDGATCLLLRQRHAERSAARALPGHRLPILLGLAEDERFWFYLRCIACVGEDGREMWADLRSGRRVLLGLRVPTNTQSRGGKGVYDDRIVVLRYEDRGNCAEFEANTDPSSRYEDGFAHADQEKATTTDANPTPKKKAPPPEGDRGDLGRLPYGVYRFNREAHKKYGTILRPDQKIVAERDTNHNGWFSSKDVVTRRAALNSGKSILFHRGGENITGSAACQTMRPDIFHRFVAALGDQQTFLYLLMAANDGWSKPLPKIDLPMATDLQA